MGRRLKAGAALIAGVLSCAAAASPDLAVPENEGLKGRLLESSRALSERTVGGFTNTKNAGSAWLYWTKYSNSGDKAALSSLVEMAQEGSPEALNMLGHIQAEGIMRPANIQDAVQRFSVAASKGFGLAQYNLGLLYLQGRGVPQDERRALSLFRQSIAKEKIEQAMVRLLLAAHAAGRNTEAWTLANQAAELKNRVGIYMIGRMLYDGTAPNRDPSAAKRWLHQAAEMYSPEAAELLARIYAGDNKNANGEIMSAGWDIIAAGMRRQGASVVAQRASRLDISGQEKARRFATEWLGSHQRPPPTEYEKTLPLLGARGK